jgi:hypothetical protein
MLLFKKQDTMQRMLVLLFPVLYLSALTAQEIPQLSGTDLPGLTAQSNNVYDGNALWGYMNGGADLYLEYGFEGMRVQEIEVGSTTLKIELCQMQSPEAAFGMFSIKRFKCNQSAMLVQHDCLTSYQYQAAVGNYYISVVNYTGSEQDIAQTVKAAGSLVQIIDGKDFQIPVFDDVDPQQITIDKIKLVRGQLGLQNGVSKWTKMFTGINDFDVYFLPVSTSAGDVFFAEILFDSPEDQTSFITRNFGLQEGSPIYENINGKTFGLFQLSPAALRLVEIAGKINDYRPLLSEFGF